MKWIGGAKIINRSKVPYPATNLVTRHLLSPQLPDLEPLPPSDRYQLDRDLSLFANL